MARTPTFELRDDGIRDVTDELARETLNACPVEAPPVSDEAEHFYICEACGQAVDMRRLGDVMHHEDPGHQPLAVQ